MTIDARECADTATAIMFWWMDDREAYDRFYASIKNHVGGVFGVTEMAGAAGCAFVEVENRQDETAGETFYWVEAIVDYADAVMESLEGRSSPPDFHGLASKAINSNRIED